MRKILYYLSVCLVVGLVSCSSDDDNGSGNGGVVGHWKSVSQVSVTTNIKTGEETTRENPDYQLLSIWLYEDGACRHEGYNGTYHRLGSELNIETSGGRYNYIIKELSGRRMVLSRTTIGADMDLNIPYRVVTETTMERVD